VHDLATVRLLRKLESLARVTLPAADVERLASTVRTMTVPAKQAAFHEAEPCPRIFVVRAGLFKQLYTAEAGHEWVKSFAREDEAFACPVALSGGHTTFASIAIEPSVVEIVEWDAIESLGAMRREWQTAIRHGFQYLAELKVRRERDLLMLNPEELYRQFIESRPELVPRVPQKDLAAYLGVTAVGLNRIAKRVRPTQAGDRSAKAVREFRENRP
jgi:CRP-like cAMP-binding protein